MVLPAMRLPPPLPGSSTAAFSTSLAVWSVRPSSAYAMSMSRAAIDWSAPLEPVIRLLPRSSSARTRWSSSDRRITMVSASAMRPSPVIRAFPSRRM